MTDALTAAYTGALAMMEHTGPRHLHRSAAFAGSSEVVGDGTPLLRHLETAGPNDALRQRIHLALATWDRAPTDSPWSRGTTPNTAERRRVILDKLEIDEATAKRFNELFPVELGGSPIIIAAEWQPWRTAETARSREFYWPHYKAYLLAKGWQPEAISVLDESTERIVERLADPCHAQAYQAKGLVVGYVQSGKTANFTGVIAKAIDAGYRLIVVLTGVTNMLRAQTQRRLDMELVGRENLEREQADESEDGDYATDPDWIGDRFLRHGVVPSSIGKPEIHRMTSYRWDYRLLRQGIEALQFERRERHLPFFHPDNLYTSNARLVVAKKNAKVLKDLVHDLKRNKKLGDVPVLIIDDESDQASINTINPAKWKADRPKRTKISGYIAELLSMLPRAQYVGYTATPFANVFVDPNDADGIFPRDFIVSLPRPQGYMGAGDFHDLDHELPDDEQTYETSNVKAHVRLLSPEPDDTELRTAVDMYVLTAAMKIFRERQGVASYRHHTMLVHEAVRTADQRAQAELIRAMWNTGGYYTGTARNRLKALFEKDLLPVSVARSDGLPTPKTYEDLEACLGDALALINPSGSTTDPVLVVNSDDDIEQESVDFDQRRVWRILVGGNKLARGFTIEGLTISYYRRATNQADTLMQMGRWFGFRPGYRDLVRLYTTPDLQEAFAAACLDEEHFRAELKRYSVLLPDGRPQVVPRQVPPLVTQHLRRLRPTSPNKMFNSDVAEIRSPGRAIEPFSYCSSAADLRAVTRLFMPYIATSEVCEFVRASGKGTFGARVRLVGHGELIMILEKFRWGKATNFKPHENWIRGMTEDQARQWVLIFPQADEKSERVIFDEEEPHETRPPAVSIFPRRAEDGVLGSRSDPQHRNAVERIAGFRGIPVLGPRNDSRIAGPVPDDQADAYPAGTGAILVYPFYAYQPPEGERASVDDIPGEPGGPIEAGQVTMALYILAPRTATPKDGQLVKFVVKDKSREMDVVVDRPKA